MRFSPWFSGNIGAFGLEGCGPSQPSPESAKRPGSKAQPASIDPASSYVSCKVRGAKGLAPSRARLNIGPLVHSLDGQSLAAVIRIA
jgi:hypothetical protein